MPQSASDLSNAPAPANRSAEREFLGGGRFAQPSAASTPQPANRESHVIRQTGSGEVVLDSIEVREKIGTTEVVVPAPVEARRTASPAVVHDPTDDLKPDLVAVVTTDSVSFIAVEPVEVAGAQSYGAEAPREISSTDAFEYPQPACPEEDPVIEAHVHVADAETPEKLDAEEVIPRQDPSRITRIARRLGSFFRPKSATARVRPHDVDLTELVAENFLIPVEGVDRDKLRDSFLDSRGQYARHLAIDIGAPRGTPILATADGQIVKLTREMRGGITIYQRDSSSRYLFFYCHLSRYARGLRPGQKVEKGEVIGYVGATGHVIGGPHLHFSITRLPEDADNLREGLAINPYLLFLAGVP